MVDRSAVARRPWWLRYRWDAGRMYLGLWVGVVTGNEIREGVGMVVGGVVLAWALPES